MMLGSRSMVSSGGPGTWPVIEAQATTTITTNAASFSMNLPSGIVPGDMLLCMTAVGSNYPRNLPSGWTLLTNLHNAVNYANGDIFWKVATGSDALTITLASGTTSLTGAVMRISGANFVEYAKVNDYYDTDPNPPLLTPSISGKKYLYIAGAVSSGTIGASSAPLNYTGLTNLPGKDGNACSLFFAHRSGLDTAEDPGVFIGGSSYHDVFTLAVYSTT